MKSDEKSWISTTQTGESQPLDDHTKLMVNMVFARFKAAYGHRFESTYGDGSSLNIAKREWGYCIQGYSEAQLAKALHTCKLKHPWPPAISEFIILLKPDPQELGLPSTRQAYVESCKCRQDPKTFPWSHDIIYHAVCNTGLWRIKSSPEKDVFPVFEAEYDALLKRFVDGETFSIPDKLEIEDKTTLTELVNAQVLAEKFDLDASEFYFMTLTKGSETRQRFRAALIKKHPEVESELPD